MASASVNRYIISIGPFVCLLAFLLVFVRSGLFSNWLNSYHHCQNQIPTDLFHQYSILTFAYSAIAWLIIGYFFILSRPGAIKYLVGSFARYDCHRLGFNAGRHPAHPPYRHILHTNVNISTIAWYCGGQTKLRLITSPPTCIISREFLSLRLIRRVKTASSDSFIRLYQRKLLIFTWHLTTAFWTNINLSIRCLKLAALKHFFSF